MIADSIAFCRGAGQARRSTTPSTSSTATATTPATRSNACAAAVDAGAENVTLCDTNGGSLPDQVAEATAAVVDAARRSGSRSASTPTTTPSARSPTRSPRCGAGARLVQGTINGYGERCGNANLASILPALQLKMGFEVRRRRAARGADRDRPLRRRALQHDAEPRPALRRPQRLRPQGRACTSPGSRPTPAPSSTSTRRWSATSATILASELSGKATIRSQAERAGLELDDEAARARGRAAQGARAPRLPLRGGAGLLRAAAAARGRQLRAALRARELPRRHREARRRRGRDRGDDQGRGRRRALRPGRRGQRPGQRARPRPARRDRRPLPAPGRHRADQLQGPHPRRSPRHRRRHPRPARLLRRRARVGDDRRLGEHHRGLLGGAGRLARVRLPAARASSATRAADRPSRSRSPGPSSAPARRSWCSRCCARAGSRWGRWASASSATFAAWLGVEDAVAVSSGTTALHLGVRALGWGAGRRGPDQPLQLRRLGQLPALRGRAAGLLRRRPGDAQPRPGGRRGGASASAPPGILPVHIFGYPAAMPELEALAAEHGLGILEDACEALGAVDSEGRAVGARGNLATFAFYANKQMTTGEGGMIVPADAEAAARLRSERNQGRAADMGWLDHDRLGFNYRLSDLAGGARRRPGREARRAARRARAAVAALYARAAWPAIEGVDARRSPAAARSGAAGSSTSSASPTGVDRDAVDRPPRRARRSPARPTCPASTSSRTCASSATARASSRSPKPPRPRSLALPFFPAMSEAQVDRVVLRGSRPNRR